jgi:hypothetical protein
LSRKAKLKDQNSKFKKAAGRFFGTGLFCFVMLKLFAQ